MKYIRLFDTENAYNSEKDEFEYPTVSLVQDVDDVRYMTLRDKYTKEYLTFEALEAGTFTLSIPANVDSNYMTSVSYSTDNGETWTTITVDDTAQTITTPTINAGDKVLWKGVGKSITKSATDYSSFSATGNYIANGNVMSLLYGDEFADQVAFPSGSTYNFCCLFRNNNKLILAENLILPTTTLTRYCYQSMFAYCTSLATAPVLSATTLADYCYNSMFYGCTSLTTAPVLPATTLVSYCYNAMFKGCTSLTTAPKLPATTLSNDCYDQMFSGCTSLTTAPVLPATTLASNCYSGMFQNCTSLTTAPVLPATTLAYGCYNQMFSGCTRLNYIKAMFTTTPSTSYTNRWVQNVAASGTFVKNSAAEWNVTGTYGVPSGWTIETASS